MFFVVTDVGVGIYSGGCIVIKVVVDVIAINVIVRIEVIFVNVHVVNVVVVADI